MGSSIWSKIIISDEEYERRKAQNNKVKVKSSNTLVSESTINGIKKAINYFDSLFITEEEYQKRKKEKKERKAYQKAEAKKKAYETAEIERFTENWVKTMAYIGLKNSMSETFALRNVKYELYGFSCNIHAPYGLTLAELETEKTVNIIQDNLRCLFRIKKVAKSNHVEAKFIIHDIPLVDFTPIKLSPYQLYMSTGIDGQAMTSNMIKYPHVLVQGSTNMGKTKFIDLMVTNLITTESPEDVNFYIVQADKFDQVIYRKCKHCKGYAENVVQTYCMLRYLLGVVEARNEKLKLLLEDGICGNAYEYNQAIEKGILKNEPKWTTLYLVIDEYASLMPDGEYNKDIKEIKQMIQSMMDRILQISRATGLYAILSTQRATIDKMPSFVKAMCCTIVTFRVNNRKSSEVAIDTGEAVTLKQREFITKIEDVAYGRTVNLSPELLLKCIKPYKTNQAPADFNSFNNIEELKDLKKGGKKGKGRASKKERRENKKKALEEDIKASDPSILKNNNGKVKTKTDFLPTHEKESSNLDKPINKPSSFLLDNWVDPLSDPNIKVIDKTGISVNTEKPKKENE